MRLSIACAVAAISVLGCSAAYAGNGNDNDQGNGNNQRSLKTVIDQLSATLVKPLQFPQLAPTDLFSQGSTEDIVAITQVFSTYVSTNDSHNGAAMASLYLPNGVDDHGWNQNGLIVPNAGINGAGCVLTGPKQIAQYIDTQAGKPAQPFPGHSHHVATNLMIKIVGDDAMMQAPWFIQGTDDSTGLIKFSAGGEYITTYKRTDQGWKIRTNHVIWDAPKTSTICDLGGPLPR
jgi:SnoaL-like domain